MSRGREKHIPYYVVLDALKQSQGCFLCSLEAQSLDSYFETLLYEHVNDPDVRKNLKVSAGYCNRHASRLLKRGDSFGTSILYSDHVERFLDEIENLTASTKQREKNKREIWLNHAGCPACSFQLETRRRHIEVFTEWFDESEMLDAFHKAKGICIPHFFEVYFFLTKKEKREELCSIVRKKYEELRDDLRELQRKNNWRFSREPMGKERDSWKRAVDFVAGAEGLF